MAYTIQVDRQTKRVRHTPTEVVSRLELDDMWRQVLQTDEFLNPGYYLLSDYRGAQFDIDTEEIGAIDNFLNAIEKYICGNRNAVITNNPTDIAPSNLVELDVCRKIDF